MDVMTTADEHPVKSGGELSRLDAAAALATGDPAAAFDLLPWLGTSIDADAAARRFRRMGLSTVIDENTGTSVVAASVFRALHERAGIDARFPVGNAGLLHVYGYLLSTTPTPYGLKRERWLDGELARAYGLAADAFLPWALPTGETLLARVTAAAAALLLYAPVRRQQLGDTEALIAIGARRGIRRSRPRLCTGLCAGQRRHAAPHHDLSRLLAHGHPRRSGCRRPAPALERRRLSGPRPHHRRRFHPGRTDAAAASPGVKSPPGA